MKKFSNLLRTLPSETKYAIISLVFPYNEDRYTLVVSSPLNHNELTDFFTSRSCADGVQFSSLSVFDDIDSARRHWAKMRTNRAFEDEIYNLDSLARLIGYFNSFETRWIITLDKGTRVEISDKEFRSKTLDSLAGYAYSDRYVVERTVKYPTVG